MSYHGIGATPVFRLSLDSETTRKMLTEAIAAKRCAEGESYNKSLERCVPTTEATRLSSSSGRTQKEADRFVAKIDKLPEVKARKVSGGTAELKPFQNRRLTMQQRIAKLLSEGELTFKDSDVPTYKFNVPCSAQNTAKYVMWPKLFEEAQGEIRKLLKIRPSPTTHWKTKKEWCELMIFWCNVVLYTPGVNPLFILASDKAINRDLCAQYKGYEGVDADKCGSRTYPRGQDVPVGYEAWRDGTHPEMKNKTERKRTQCMDDKSSRTHYGFAVEKPNDDSVFGVYNKQLAKLYNAALQRCATNSRGFDGTTIPSFLSSLLGPVGHQQIHYWITHGGSEGNRGRGAHDDGMGMQQADRAAALLKSQPLAWATPPGTTGGKGWRRGKHVPMPVDVMNAYLRQEGQREIKVWQKKNGSWRAAVKRSPDPAIQETRERFYKNRTPEQRLEMFFQQGDQKSDLVRAWYSSKEWTWMLGPQGHVNLIASWGESLSKLKFEKTVRRGMAFWVHQAGAFLMDRGVLGMSGEEYDKLRRQEIESRSDEGAKALNQLGVSLTNKLGPIIGMIGKILGAVGTWLMDKMNTTPIMLPASWGRQYSVMPPMIRFIADPDCSTSLANQGVYNEPSKDTDPDNPNYEDETYWDKYKWWIIGGGTAIAATAVAVPLLTKNESQPTRSRRTTPNRRRTSRRRRTSKR